MRLPLIQVLGLLPAPLHSQGPASFKKPLRFIDSIPAPESVAVGPDGAWYVSSFGKFGNGSDGAVYRVDPDKGTREIFAGGLEDPCGVLFVGATLWVADRKGVYRVTRQAFPRPSVLSGSDTVRAQSSANGLFSGSGDTLYVVGYRTGVLSVTDGHGSWSEIARGLGSPDGIDAAEQGSAFYVSGHTVTLAAGFKAPADLVVDRRRGWLVVPENDGNRLSVYRSSGSAR